MQIRWKKVFFEDPRLFEFLNPHHHRIHSITKWRFFPIVPLKTEDLSHGMIEDGIAMGQGRS